MAPSTTSVAAPADRGLFVKALLLGLAGGVSGGLLFAVFTELTGFAVPVLALLIAFMVAKGMMIGSKGRGGLSYRLTAVVLTYLCVSLGYLALTWWDSRDNSVMDLDNLLTMGRYSLLHAVSQLQHSALRGGINLVVLLASFGLAWVLTSGSSRR